MSKHLMNHPKHLPTGWKIIFILDIVVFILTIVGFNYIVGGF